MHHIIILLYRCKAVSLSATIADNVTFSNLFCRKAFTPSTLSAGFLLLILSFLSGNTFGQNEGERPKSPAYIVGPVSGATQADVDPIAADTVPRFYNYVAEFGFGLAFPLRDFHASDPGNEFAGYALQGYSLSTSLFMGFTGNSEAGWHFGASYTTFRKSPAFTDTLRSMLDAFEPDEGESQEGTLSVADDFRSRYDVFSLRTGFGFEGSDQRVSAYGSFMLNLNFIHLNRILLETDGTAQSLRAQGGEFHSDVQITSGISASFGLRFQQQLSVGLTWHYLGTAEMSYDRRRSNLPAETVLNDLPMQRRFHFLEVKLGYGLAKRSGEREPKVKLRY